jgi:UDP-N-acetyl-D-glucosamine dehydrogenase
MRSGTPTLDRPARRTAREPAGPDPVTALAGRFAGREATVAVLGLGHVGLPLARAAAAAGFRAIGFDTDRAKIARLAAGDSPLRHVPAEALRTLLGAGRLRPTDDAAALAEAEALILCVPTPLGPGREPDLTHVVAATRTVARHLRPGRLIVLESTTWPGTTRSVVQPILEETGLRCGQDFFLAYSPQREDPGNAHFPTEAIPKLVAGADARARRLALALYGAIVARPVPVASLEVAEAAKLAENVFRAVNIALANELKHSFGAMGLDAWEVIEAAATKPFGYIPFWPGPGPGGHCIPVDPHYLAWAARAHGAPARLVELATALNEAAPRQVLRALEAALRARGEAGLAGRRVLVVGLGYKRNIADLRESPGLALLGMLRAEGAMADYFDPLVPRIPPLPGHPGLAGLRGLSWDEAASGWDAVLIATDHDGVDYAALLAATPLVVDTRNLCARLGLSGQQVVKA